jgi:hypothetical protein
MSAEIIQPKHGRPTHHSPRERRREQFLNLGAERSAKRGDEHSHSACVFPEIVTEAFQSRARDSGRFVAGHDYPVIVRFKRESEFCLYGVTVDVVVAVTRWIAGRSFDAGFGLRKQSESGVEEEVAALIALTQVGGKEPKGQDRCHRSSDPEGRVKADSIQRDLNMVGGFAEGTEQRRDDRESSQRRESGPPLAAYSINQSVEPHALSYRGQGTLR